MCPLLMVLDLTENCLFLLNLCRLECAAQSQEPAASVPSHGRDLRPVFAHVPVAGTDHRVGVPGLTGTRLALPHDARSGDSGRALRPAVGQQQPFYSGRRVVHPHPRLSNFCYHSGNWTTFISRLCAGIWITNVGWSPSFSGISSRRRMDRSFRPSSLIF